jgi:hypothetical protein
MSKGKWKNNSKICCIECKREFSIAGFRTHYLRAHLNDERFANSGWKIGCEFHPKQNGFTKGTQITHSIETKNKISKSNTGKTVSDQTRQKISKSRKEFLKDNPDKVPYLLNHSSKISYPEKYFIDCFSHINENKEIEYRIGNYSLDFANPKYKIYLEIDGEQHYCDKRIVEHDKKRTEFLNSIGWKGIRIRWSEFQKKSKEEKYHYLKEIIIKMNWEHYPERLPNFIHT